MYIHNIGDIVQVINYPALVPDMSKYYMQPAIIVDRTTKVYSWGDGDKEAYTLDCDDGYYRWKGDWLRPVLQFADIEQSKINISETEFEELLKGE